MNSITLYDLNNIVRQTLELTLPEPFWIRAEISEIRFNRHCYLELVQKDKSGNGLIAKARAQIWANSWYILKNHFERVTNQPLSAGMEILVQAEVTFHEVYGFSLNIVDIDPTYTLGDIARRRMEIIRTLKEEGIFDMNRELQLPRLIQRIAIISSASAAGYGDFCDQLQSNKSGLAFHTQLFPASMQGNDVERSVIAALNHIADDIDSWDIVVIIRGGGSVTDLSGFDSLDLAENVAQFPIPIITGIGHERDDTIIDLISHTRVKTPTAAAEFLIHHQEAELLLINDLADRIFTATNETLVLEKQRISTLTSKLPTLFEIIRQRENARIDRIAFSLQSSIVQTIANEKVLISNRMQQLSSATESLITRQHHTLDVINAKLDGADPQRILNLGFSITRINGKAVQDADILKPGDIIETTFKSGTTKSIIQTTQEHPEIQSKIIQI